MPWEGRTKSSLKSANPANSCLSFCRSALTWIWFFWARYRTAWMGSFRSSNGVWRRKKPFGLFRGFFLRENDEMRSFDYLEWILIFQGRFFSFLFGFRTKLNMVSFFLFCYFLFCFWLLTIILIIFFFLKFQIHHLVNLFWTVA